MVQKFKTLSAAIALAEFAHRNQTDKAGYGYIEHPRRVLAKVQAQGAQPYVQMAAILHDVTEDTAFTHEMLLDLGFSEAVVNIVKLLDRDYSKTIYDGYVRAVTANPENLWWTGKGYIPQDQRPTADEFYYEQIKRNPGALMVKLDDIEDNLSPWRLAYLSEDTQKRLKTKYAKARQILQPGVWTSSSFPHNA